MSKKMASVIAAYGVVLAALGLIIQQTAPAFAQVVFLTGVAGGGLCVLWSLIAFAGHKRRVWAMLTMIPVAVVMLIQVVHAWSASNDATSMSLTGRLVLTLMFLMTVGMLMYVLHGERPPEFYDSGTARRDKPSSRGEPAQQPVAARRP
jgi:hypothetical protein